MGEKEVVALAFCTFLLGVTVLVVGAGLVIRWKGLAKEDVFCGVAAVRLHDRCSSLRTDFWQGLYVLDTAFLFLGTCVENMEVLKANA